MESAVTPLHLLSYCLDPRFAEESSTKLSRDLAAKAVNYAATVSDKLVPVIAKFRVRSPPFDSPYMSEATRKSMMPADWWKLLDVEKDVLETIQCILSCSPSTADLERIFSTYSWVHSKERNRLGVEKSAKLVFVLKTLNMSRWLWSIILCFQSVSSAIMKCCAVKMFSSLHCRWLYTVGDFTL